MSRNIEQEIALRLREALVKKGIPHQQALADMAGVSRSTVSYIFRKAGGRKQNLEKLQLVLHPYNLEWILTGRGLKCLDGSDLLDIATKIPDEELDVDVEKAALNAMQFSRIIDSLTRTGKMLEMLVADYKDDLAAMQKMIRGEAGGGPRLRMTAEPQYEGTEMRIEIPPPPPDLSEEDRKRWQRNALALDRWSQTEHARAQFPRGVKPYAIERFCREVYSFYEGASLKDVGGLLKDLEEEGGA